VSGQDSFEIASAVAAIFGLAAALVLALGAMVFTWLLFRRASDASLATTRVAVSLEDLVRLQPGHQPFGQGGADGGQFADLRDQAETLVEQQRHLQEMARNLLDASVAEGASPAAMDELEATVTRLDATVGQMAASLANLIQLLESRER